MILGLLNTVSDDAYKAALNQLLPELYSDAEISALYASLGFSNSLLSCKVNGTDTAAIIREGQCLWAGANARFLDSGTTFDQIGFNETAGLFTAGAQVALDNVWRLGFAGGYQTSTLDTATNAQSQGSLGQGGVALKYNPGPLLIAGTLSGGGGQYDTKRPMSFGGFTGLAEGDQSLGFFNGGMRIAYVFGEPHLYWKPTLDMNLTYLHLGAVAESGGNGAGLAIASQGQTVFTLAPTLEAGTEWWLAGGTLVRPMLRAGAIWYTNNDLALNASFESAPAGVGPFTINTKLDDVMGLVSAGVDVITGCRLRAAPLLRCPARRDDADPKRRHQGQRKVLATPRPRRTLRPRCGRAAQGRRDREGHARWHVVVAMIATFLSGIPGGQQAGEQCRRRGEPGENRGFARRFDRAHRILVGLIDALLRLSLRDAGALGDDLRQRALLRRRKLSGGSRRRQCARYSGACLRVGHHRALTGSWSYCRRRRARRRCRRRAASRLRLRGRNAE